MDNLRTRAYSSRHAAQRYATNYDNAKTSHSEDGENSGSIDLGWRLPEQKKTRKNKDTGAKAADVTGGTDASERREAAKVRLPLLPVNHRGIEWKVQAHRTRLLKELSARLHRDRMLRYAERELEMQRLLMGKGRSMKLKGVERVDGKDDSEDEDTLDARKGRGSTSRKGDVKHVDEKLYKPRVYKWRAERKR
jgi:U3 small nucleolar RNA-associated protein 11